MGEVPYANDRNLLKTAAAVTTAMAVNTKEVGRPSDLGTAGSSTASLWRSSRSTEKTMVANRSNRVGRWFKRRYRKPLLCLWRTYIIINRPKMRFDIMRHYDDKELIKGVECVNNTVCKNIGYETFVNLPTSLLKRLHPTNNKFQAFSHTC